MRLSLHPRWAVLGALLCRPPAKRSRESSLLGPHGPRRIDDASKHATCSLSLFSIIVIFAHMYDREAAGSIWPRSAALTLRKTMHQSSLT